MKESNPFADHNPYAPPLDSGGMPPQQSPIGIWRQGKLLVMHKQAILPSACVKSNEPATGRLIRKLTWHSPLVYLVILFNLIIYAIVAMAVSKRAKIEIGLSETWFAKRRRAIIFGWTGVITGFVFLFGGLMSDLGTSSIAVAGIALSMPIMLLGALYGALGARMVYAKKIDDNFVWLGGVHQDYLAKLPEWPGER